MKRLIFLFVIIFALASCKKDNPDPNPNPGPDPEPEQEIVISPKTKPVPEEARLAIVSVDSNFNFTIMPGMPYFDTLKAGDIMVDGVSDMAPNGYLRKVVSIEDNGKGFKEIKTTQATLVETCKKGSIRFNSGDIKIGQIKKMELAKGVTLKNLKNTDFTVFDFDVDKSIDFNGTKVNLNGNSKLKMDLFFDFDWSVEFDFDWVPISINVDLFQTGVEVNQSSSLKIEVENELEFDKKIVLAKFYVTPITFFVGPIPVVFTPTVTLYADMNGNVSANVTVSASESFDGKLGIKYDGDWNAIAEKTFNTDYTAPVLNGNAEANVGIGPNVNILLYGIVGPYAYMDGCAGLDATVNGTNWNLDLNIGLRYNVGIQVDILGFEEDWSLSDEPMCLFKKNMMHLEDEPLGNNIYITNPVDDANLVLGSEVTISTYYTGDKPDEVKFYIDNNEVASVSQEPFEYLWNTGDYNQGQHTVKVVEIIDGSEISSDESTVNITVQSWQIQNVSSLIGTNPVSLYLYFLDDQTGWISAFNSQASNVLLKTEDGGDTWSKVYDKPMEGPLMQFKFMGPNDGIGLTLGGNFCKVLSSGGSDMQEMIPTGSSFPTFDNYTLYNFDISPIDGTMYAVVTDYNGAYKILQTELVNYSVIDSISIPETIGHNIIKFNGEKGVVCDIRGTDGNSKVMITNDGGSSWSTKTLPGLGFLDATNASFIYDDNLIYLAGCHFSINQFNVPEYAFVMISNDGGNSWEKVNVNDVVGFTSISMVSAEKGYASVGYESDNEEPKLYYTSDGCHTWEPVPEVSSKRPVKQVVFKGEDFGFAMDDQGTVFRFTNAK